MTVPESLDFSNLDQYSDEQIEAYNAQKNEELDERIGELEGDQEQAVRSLRESAESTLSTATVELSRGEDSDPVELEVRERMPQKVEEMRGQLDDLRDGGSVQRAKLVACRMLAEMVHSPEAYTDPEVWFVAQQFDDGGIGWLMEAAQDVLEPVRSRVEENQGNSNR